MYLLNKNFILKEISKWENDGIINAQTAKILFNKYENSQKNINFIIKFIICLLIGIALIILIAHNLENTPRFLRISGLILITLAIQVYGLILYKKDKEGNHIIIFFLGCLVYGASIILISQIYHLGQYMSEQILLWAIGSLIFAIILQSISITILSFLLSYIAFFTNYYIYFEIDYRIIIFFVASLYIALKKHSNFLMFLCISFIYLFPIFIYTSTKYEEYDYLRYQVITSVSFLFGIFITMLLWLVMDLISKFKKINCENFIRGFIYTAMLSILFFINLNFNSFSLSYEVSELIKLLILFILISSLLIKNYYLAIMSTLSIFFFDNLYTKEAYFYITIITSLLIIVFSTMLIYSNRLKTGIFILSIFILLKCLYLFNDDYVSTSLLFLLFSVILIILYKIRSRKIDEN